jgi:hypothetical protein
VSLTQNQDEFVNRIAAKKKSKKVRMNMFQHSSCKIGGSDYWESAKYTQYDEYCEAVKYQQFVADNNS